jgi:formyltetrahydrofolate synthetase
MDAAPLPTSPQVTDQDPIANNVKKLTIHIEECKDIDLCVVFAISNLSMDDYEFTNISDLCYEGDETEQTVTETTESKASGSCNSISLCTPAAVALVGATAVITSKRKKEKKK